MEASEKCVIKNVKVISIDEHYFSEHGLKPFDYHFLRGFLMIANF